jgi:hypothetical protein
MVLKKRKELCWGFEKKYNFLFLQIVQAGFAAHSAFFLMGTGSLSLGPEHEVDI